MRHPALTAKFRPLTLSSGFTIIELMVTLSIAAVLVSLALPSFERQIKRWQFNQDANALTDTIYLARSEAIKWGGNIQVERIPNSAACSTGSANLWSCGWQIRLTTIPSGATGIPTSGPLKGVIRQVQTNEKTRITTPAGSATLNLNRWGNPNAGYGIHIQHINDNGDAALDQYLCLSSGGRLRQAGSCS